MNGKNGSSKHGSILVIDDDLGLAETIADGLADHGFAATPISDPKQAIVATNLAHLVSSWPFVADAPDSPLPLLQLWHSACLLKAESSSIFIKAP